MGRMVAINLPTTAAPAPVAKKAGGGGGFFLPNFVNFRRNATYSHGLQFPKRFCSCWNVKGHSFRASEMKSCTKLVVSILYVTFVNPQYRKLSKWRFSKQFHNTMLR